MLIRAHVGLYKRLDAVCDMNKFSQADTRAAKALNRRPAQQNCPWPMCCRPDGYVNQQQQTIFFKIRRQLSGLHAQCLPEIQFES